MSILTGQACPDKRGKPTTYTSQIMIIDAPPAALPGKSAGKRKNTSEKARSSIFNKVDKTDWPWLPRLSMLLIRDLQVNHWDCMCTRQEARNWWRPACLNKGFACVIVSLQREHGGAERLRTKKIKIAVMELQHSTVQSHLRWELRPLWWKRSLGTLWASLLTLGSRSALCLDWWHPLIPWQKELKCSIGRGGRD